MQIEKTPTSIQPFSDSGEIIRASFIKRGLSKDTTEIMFKSLSTATIKQYQGSLKLWSQFAAEKNIDMFNANSTDVISFLTKKWQEGASYSTLNTSRSAVALISIQKISEDGLISRFMKGVYKQKPPAPKYDCTWDTVPVLKYLKTLHPLNSLTPKGIGEKVATLLALTSAHRLQTLALIDINNIKYSKSGVTIKRPETIKTSKPGAFQPELVFPYFKNKPGLCMATVIKDYLEYTKDLRAPDNSKLLISTIKPYGPVSAQTLGHWIKRLLGKAGIDTEQFSAYSTRHAAVSSAYKVGVNVDTIRRTAGWTEKSNMFAKFYNKPIGDSKEQFMHAIINNKK